MLLTDAEIRKGRFIKYAAEGHYAATSYDVGVGEIVDTDGARYSEGGYVLKPQGIVWLISSETLMLPEDVTGHAHIRTSLCSDGLLALNTGIVDPNWNGPLSTAIVNFSKQPYRIKIGEKFLRISFYKHERPTYAAPVSISRKNYIDDKIGKAQTVFGRTFLNFEQISKEVSEKVVEDSKEKFIYRASIAALAFAFLTILISVATYSVPLIYSQPQKLSDLTEEIKNLRQEINDMRRGP
ncbi:MAG: hypothetical protein EOQ48_14000 [Mesorhizobium sp.]|uniref:dCTP deaminase domain-containing protein n=1 Tax=Mesorhizobium sp. TaxID=1871066 RepID=UPI000FE91173|nr:MAG: hypothetical protein EOQ48_14000 [Mesorhizobium sp.]